MVTFFFSFIIWSSVACLLALEVYLVGILWFLHLVFLLKVLCSRLSPGGCHQYGIIIINNQLEIWATWLVWVYITNFTEVWLELMNSQGDCYPSQVSGLPTPVFLPGEPQGRGSLVGCRRWGRTVGHDWRDLAAAAAAAAGEALSIVPSTLANAQQSYTAG